MPTDLERLMTTLPRVQTSGVSPQTNRGLIELGEHPTFTKLPVPAANVPAPLPEGPGNTKGKSSLEVMAESTGKTIEQRKAETDALNRAKLEAHRLKYAPK